MNEEFTMLIEELRTPSDGWSGDASCIDAEVGARAANTIEALRAELEAVKVERDSAVGQLRHFGELHEAEYRAIEARLAKLEAEIRRKDAALREARNAIWSGCDTISATKAVDAALTRLEE